ncbi:hypothetical protein Tco_0907117 [Tanacetum coccineum]|uniref:Uncharacterized protein n=1 Tax=Tanacetum coccineum TaxID=301880 RepID=A0ABQ5CJU3_9ASTR
MFTQEEQYIELLEPITEPHQVQQNDSNVIYVVSSVEQSGEIVEQHPATVEETRAYFESLYNNLAIKSIYQEQCLTIKINALHLSSAKMIMTLNEEIANLNNQLSKEKLIVSYLQQEKKKLKSDFKTRKDELLDKQIQLENKIKELDNILVKMGQSIQTMHMLSPKPDSFYHTEHKMALGYQNPFYLKQAWQKQQSLYNGKILLEKHDPPDMYDSKETLQLAQESRLKMKQLNNGIIPKNYAKINQLSKVFVSQKAKSHKELYFLNTSKTTSVSKSVSKSISIPNEEFSDDTSPSVARKLLNELFDKVSEQKDTTKGTNANTKSANQLILGKPSLQLLRNHFVVRQPNTFQSERPKFSKTQVPPKVVKTNDLANPVTSNSVPTTKESKVVTYDKVITLGMFRINPFKTSRSDSNGLSSTGVNNNAKTRRLQPRSNIKIDRVPSTSKSSCINDKDVEVEE